MALDYSQRRLLSKTLHTRSHTARAQRLRRYAVLTGFLSLLISAVTLFIRIVKK